MSHCAHEKCPCDSAKRQATPASVAACYPQRVVRREGKRERVGERGVHVCAHCCWLGKVMSKYAGACCLFYNKAKPSTKNTHTHSQFIVKYTIAHTIRYTHTHSHSHTGRQAGTRTHFHTYSYSVTYVRIEYGSQMLLIDMHVNMFVCAYVCVRVFTKCATHTHTHTHIHAACQFAGATNANVCP